MSVAEIEAAIIKLDPTDLDRLWAWLAAYRERAWDEQIADDIDSGKLDKLIADVDAEIEAGLAIPL